MEHARSPLTNNGAKKRGSTGLCNVSLQATNAHVQYLHMKKGGDCMWNAMAD